MTSKGVKLAAAGAAAWWFFLRKRTAKATINGAEATIELSSKLKPASVRSGETVSLKSYRVIAARRANMVYTQVKEGTLGQLLVFEIPAGGSKVTRNVVNDGALFVEVTP